MAASFKFIDLFAGIGGFHHALSGAGFGGECVLAVEIDSACRAVYQKAFDLPDEKLIGDIRTITRTDGRDATVEEIQDRVPDHDVLCAGFPCQPFSKSGGQMGIWDQTRGTLFFDIIEIVRAKLPRFLILENVPNLVGPRHRDTWALIIASLREAGYRVSSRPVILSPHDLPPTQGAPQVRDRVFILAARDPDNCDFEEDPLVETPPVSGWNPKDWSVDPYLDEVEPNSPYAIRAVETTWLNAWNAFVRDLPSDHIPGHPLWVDAWGTEPEILPETPAWKQDFLEKNSVFYRKHRTFLDHWLSRTWDDKGSTVRDFPASRRKFEWQARLVHPTREGRSIWDLLIHLRPSGIRVKPPTYFPALVAINQASIIGSQRRRITPAEAARLQMIPFEPFRLSGMTDGDIYKQLGNAVNVGAVRFVAQALFSRYGLDWGSTLDEALRLVG